MNGLWCYIDKNSTCWEEIYTDSVFWVYSDEAGIIVRKYKLANGTITQTYVDGTLYAEYKIISLTNNKVCFIFDGENGELRKIPKKYDTKEIIKGDTAAVWKYINDYRKRKYKWELRHKKE